MTVGWVERRDRARIGSATERVEKVSLWSFPIENAKKILRISRGYKRNCSTGIPEMRAQFFDLHDPSNPLDGSEVTTSVELSSTIDGCSDGPARFCELVAENGFKLRLGIGRDDLGCIQHSSSDDDPPYLMATNKSVLDTRDYVKFLIDNEPTAVPRYYCLPMELVKKIATYFLETGERSNDVRWEEI